MQSEVLTKIPKAFEFVADYDRRSGAIVLTLRALGSCCYIGCKVVPLFQGSGGVPYQTRIAIARQRLAADAGLELSDIKGGAGE